MSYNIDTWKTKRIENLIMSISALYENAWKPMKPFVEDAKTGEVRIVGLGEGGEIRGSLNGQTLAITAIGTYGESSGNCLHEILIPALQQSTGYLEAVLVWEGGDSITRFTVDNGIVKNEPIDL